VSNGVRTALRGLGQVLITFGVVLLLFAVYELQITGLATERSQDRLGDSLRRSWAEPTPRPVPPEPTASAQPSTQPTTAPSAQPNTAPSTQPSEQPAPAAVPVAASPDLGDGIAVLHVPALAGFDPWVVVEGTSVANLKRGPGHIRGTALPGEVGNVVLSGHRTTYGAPFGRLGELRPGDSVVLETRDRWLTYSVTGTRIVAPTAIEVTYPVPGKRRATPTERLLTLTTCHPRYSARQRMVVSAVLSAEQGKDAGPPAGVRVSA
jgi:sortase A